MQVVSNTSPLSALSIIGRLGILRTQFGSIRIPNAVWIELSRLDHDSGRLALEQAHAEGWILVHQATNRAMVEILSVTLDAGESEAIAMSQEWPADLLIMDKSSGRAMARNLKIRITGTLGLLLKQKGAVGVYSNTENVSMRHLTPKEQGLGTDSSNISKPPS